LEFDLDFLVEASSFSLLSDMIRGFLESIRSFVRSAWTSYCGFVILLYPNSPSAILLGSMMLSLFDLLDIRLISSFYALIISGRSAGGSSIELSLSEFDLISQSSSIIEYLW